MTSQWDNFLRNQGEWRGTFTSLGPDAQVLQTTATILNLEQGDEERLVHFRLRRFANGDLNGEPSRDNREDYRALGRQVVFFGSGSFCKGTLQVAPGTVFGGEFGFIHGDRRHRLVQLHHEDGSFDQLVLIREWRTGHDEPERPALQLDHLIGSWVGQAQRISADWPEPDSFDGQLEVQRLDDGAVQWRSQAGDQIHTHRLQGEEPVLAMDGGSHPQRFTLLADGGYHLGPHQVSHREPFSVEAGWLIAPNHLERLVRRFDGSGAWLDSTHWVLQRA